VSSSVSTFFTASGPAREAARRQDSGRLEVTGVACAQAAERAGGDVLLDLELAVERDAVRGGIEGADALEFDRVPIRSASTRTA
jgi:hypothetical protein